jgi:hypothetical protein
MATTAEQLCGALAEENRKLAEALHAICQIYTTQGDSKVQFERAYIIACQALHAKAEIRIV